MTLRSKSDALLDTVIAWRDTPAKADVRGLPRVNVPTLATLRKALPTDSAPRLLAASYAAALKLSQPAALLRQAGAQSLAELQSRPLAESHALALRVARQSGWLAGGTGAAFGVAGVFGMAADAPALLLLALRALIRIGYCYGETASPTLVTALFALASADTDEEKRLAWQAALMAPAHGAKVGDDAALEHAALRDGLERAAEREFAKQALSASLQKLALTLARRLGVKKAAGALPLVGAVVSGAVNIRFMVLLTEAARMAFAARRSLAEGVPAASLLMPTPLPAGLVPKLKTRKPTAQARKTAAQSTRLAPSAKAPASARPKR